MHEIAYFFRIFSHGSMPPSTRSTLKVEANLTQILNFKANFHTEFEPFFKKKNYANNSGHFKIVSTKIKN